MEIVIIGTGNTATVLGRKFKAAKHNVVQIFGRDAAAASALAQVLGAESTSNLNALYRDADIYLVAVSDKAIEEIAKVLPMTGKTVVHTAASVSKEVLKDAAHYGVFYPLQSLRKETTHLPDIPVIIDASDKETLSLLKNLAHSISDKVSEGSDEMRAKLHLAAVFTNNFVNHLYVLAEKYCTKEGIDYQFLLPLIRETAERMDILSPAQVQTGPAVRGDDATINRHLELLKSYPELKAFYGLFTESMRSGT